MGRFGPAFLAYQNFQVYLQWNQSLNYSITAAHLAMRLAGAPAMSRGSGVVPELSFAQVKELQQLMTRRGFFEGEADGKIGAATRAGVKKVQLKLGFPADSYPTPELLEKLRH
jgi:peptidoglycan hydrolase-like protein with peptidoglycan-binding domain